jgi:drug/metabolite transporter (DMT)-like permease
VVNSGSVLSGELLALGTAVCWTASALNFEYAGRRVGSLPVNFLRLAIALLVLCVYCAVMRGKALPTDASWHNWKWLLASGFAGFFISDLCMFRAYVVVGSRLGTLCMALAPPMAAISEFYLLGTPLGARDIFGMAIALAGIIWVITEGPLREADAEEKFSLKGLGLILVGAISMGVGLTMSKIGMGAERYDGFAATQIRAIAGLASFVVFIVATGRTNRVFLALRNPRAMLCIGAGAIVGPMLGVSLLNLSVQRIPSGLAQTFTATVPVLIIPFVVVLYKQRVTVRSIVGAVVAVSGVAFLLVGRIHN